MQILTLNIGSSSIKYKVFAQDLSCLCQGSVTGIGTKLCNWPEISNHQQAISSLGTKLTTEGYRPEIICHRVVHGGNHFTAPAIINQTVIEKILSLSNLAPLHNPIQLQAIEATNAIFADAKQIAFFDTAFHHTMPESQKLIPLNIGPEIKNYGFHGLNYAYVTEQLIYHFQRPVNAIICHLGNGASVCAIKQGKSYASSMGMTPNNGLIMGTRSGNIDSGVVAYLHTNYQMPIEKIDSILNNESGLFAIAGSSDMRECEEKAAKGDKQASLALKVFVERVRFYLGGYMMLLDEIDCIAFTGGIGENSSLIRSMILDNIDKYQLDESKNMVNYKGLISQESSKPIFLIPANEEQFMAQSAMDLNGKSQSRSLN